MFLTSCLRASPIPPRMQVDIDLEALDKGGLARFSTAELREALAKRGLDDKGDRAALFARLRGALATAAGGARNKKEIISHEVVANVLVGAEEAEARLEELLNKRRELLGES